jgi:hypothetical protein
MIKILILKLLSRWWIFFNISIILFYFKHDLSKKINLFNYKFMFKYLEMDFKFSF